MPQASLDPPKCLNPTLAAQARPELERIVQELRQCLDRCADLHDSFRQKFTAIFEEPSGCPDGVIDPALLNVYFFNNANLAGQALSHLRYAVDLADLACGLLPGAPEAGRS